ncbi:MAG: carboxymuconolactone decarboxylase family protein [Methylocystis sp.]|nr:carboxymuconolactone decarboxylase family protein [Methylocystis sp.]
MVSEYRLTLEPIAYEKAEGDARDVLAKAKKQVGFIPNMYARMAHAPGLLETYLGGYKAFRTRSGFSAVEQELIFLVISRENGCEYCVAALSALLANIKPAVPKEVIEACRSAAVIADARLESLARFARRMVQSRGLPARADVEQFLAAGFKERQILDIVLAIGVKTLSNYSNHLFHTPLDPAFSAWAWRE